MMKWFRRNNRERQEREIRKKAEEALREEKEEMIQLDCKGTYTLSVTVNEKELEAQENAKYWEKDDYAPYKIEVAFDVVVKYNNVEFNLSNKLMYEETEKEREAYLFVIVLISDKKEKAVLMESLERAIVYELNEHLRNNNIEKVKKYLEDNKTFDIDFTIETEKTNIKEFSI